MSVQTEQTVTSLEVAELTGKEHKNVVRDIRDILTQMDEINQLNFEPSNYTSDSGKEYPMLSPINQPIAEFRHRNLSLS